MQLDTPEEETEQHISLFFEKTCRSKGTTTAQRGRVRALHQGGFTLNGID